MSPEYILSLQKRAKIIARMKGYANLADDFAQEVILTFLRNPKRKSTLDQLFIDYLRDQYGRLNRSTPSGGDARAKARFTNLYAARNVQAPEYSHFDSYLFLFEGIESKIYKLHVMHDVSLVDTAKVLGYQYGMVRERFQRMKKRILKYYQEEEKLHESTE